MLISTDFGPKYNKKVYGRYCTTLPLIDGRTKVVPAGEQNLIIFDVIVVNLD